jgi:hypothetical protein
MCERGERECLLILAWPSLSGSHLHGIAPVTCTSRAQLIVSPAAALSPSLSLLLGLTLLVIVPNLHLHCILYFYSPVLESSFFAIPLAYRDGPTKLAAAEALTRRARIPTHFSSPKSENNAHRYIVPICQSLSVTISWEGAFWTHILLLSAYSFLFSLVPP